MKATAKILVISGNKMLTKLMHAGDVFEKSKVFGEMKVISVDYKENEKVTLQRAAKVIEPLRIGLEENEVVSLVHVLEVTNGNVTIKNEGQVLPYINKEVRCISDGQNWGLLSKLIEAHLGLKVITDEHMFIIGCGIKDGLNELKVLKSKK